MTELFKACARGQDPLLKELGEGLVNRKLYKAVDVTFVSPRAAADFKVAAIDRIRSAGLDPVLCARGRQPFGYAVQAVRPGRPEAGQPDSRGEDRRADGRRSVRRRGASTRFKRNTACCGITSRSEFERWLFRSPQST